MVELFEEDGVCGVCCYFDYFKMEYVFWMDGVELLIFNQVYCYVVWMLDGLLFNCYWDDCDMLCDEFWFEDVEIVKYFGCLFNEVYCDLCVGVVLGWDYFFCWLCDIGCLVSICIIQFIFIDLNVFLFKLESVIVNILVLKGEKEIEVLFCQKVSVCCDVVNCYFWDDENGIYCDYDW